MVICTATMMNPTAITLASEHSSICNIVTTTSKITSVPSNIIPSSSFFKLLYIIYMKTDEPIFLKTFLHTTVTGALIPFVLKALTLYFGCFPSAFDTAFVFFFFAIINIWDAFRIVKPKLLGIHYDGENAHLFSKYIAIHELLITVGIAFLVGIIPAFCEYNHISTDTYARYASTISSLWLACVANTYKCMLVHARNVWIANHSERIYDESNE